MNGSTQNGTELVPIPQYGEFYHRFVITNDIQSDSLF